MANEVYLYSPNATLRNVTLRANEAGLINLQVPLFSNSNTLYEPTLVPGSVTVTFPLQTNTSTLYEPSVFAEQNIDIPLITSVATLYDPVLVPEQLLTVPLLSSSAVLYEPSVSQGQTLSVSFISSTGDLYVPSVTPAAVQLQIPVIGSESDLFSPELIAEGLLSVPFVSSTGELFLPKLDLNIVLGFITNSSQLFSVDIFRDTDYPYEDIPLSSPVQTTISKRSSITVPEYESLASSSVSKSSTGVKTISKSSITENEFV